mmetsp:Transcript_2774/g.3635  ORF Transcript_2774/g.3635 Transcript_2774/m.3635 type:complete len:268 (-) Transcript_2774:41-844(-)
MQKSASEPVLRDDDYHLPSNGVGATGMPPRVLMGHSSKDKGEHSSRINIIIKQAQKVPGPGKYVAHEDWGPGKANKFASTERSKKPMHKNPAPTAYERKDFMLESSNGAKDNLSTHYRVLHGKIPKGKRRSMTDAAIKQGLSVPGPGQYNLSSTGTLARKITSWDKEVSKSKSLKQKVDSLAPNHYQIQYHRLSSEPTGKVHAVPKAKGNNFIDKFVKEKWSDAKTKKELPGPGTYPIQDFNLDKTSRGTFHCQIRGLQRSPMSGYF